MSPCAYLCGLLHPKVIEELELVARGFDWIPATNGLFVPFLDGTSVQLYDDDVKCEEEIRRLRPADVEGWRAMGDVIRRLRDALRPAGDRDVWLGEAPSQEEMDSRLGNDSEIRGLLYRVVHGGVRRAVSRRSTLTGGLSRARRNRYERESLRRRDGFDSVSSLFGKARRNAGGMGLCKRRYRHGLVSAMPIPPLT